MNKKQMQELVNVIMKPTDKLISLSVMTAKIQGEKGNVRTLVYQTWADGSGWCEWTN